MHIIHTHDAELVNRIANQDGVREFIHSAGIPIDWTEAVVPSSTQTGIVVLTDGEDAVAAFTMTTPTVWQSHTLFGPKCRGRKAIETARAMVQWMFDRAHAEIVWGCTPRENRKAIIFNRWIGAHPLPTSDETHENYEIRKESWH